MGDAAQLGAIVAVVLAIFKVGEAIITKLIDKVGISKQDPVALALDRNTFVIEKQGNINQKILSFLEKQAEGARYREEAQKDQLDRIETCGRETLAQLGIHANKCAEKCYGKKGSDHG